MKCITVVGGNTRSNQNQVRCVNIGEYLVFGSIVGPDDYDMPPVICISAGDYSNQNQVMHVSLGRYLVLGSIVGSGYYHMPPRTYTIFFHVPLSGCCWPSRSAACPSPAAVHVLHAGRVVPFQLLLGGVFVHRGGVRIGRYSQHFFGCITALPGPVTVLARSTFVRTRMCFFVFSLVTFQLDS